MTYLQILSICLLFKKKMKLMIYGWLILYWNSCHNFKVNGVWYLQLSVLLLLLLSSAFTLVKFTCRPIINKLFVIVYLLFTWQTTLHVSRVIWMSPVQGWSGILSPKPLTIFPPRFWLFDPLYPYHKKIELLLLFHHPGCRSSYDPRDCCVDLAVILRDC